MDQVDLIACTCPDWPTLVSSCVRMFGSSPTRELDKRNINVGSPATYAMTLENVNNNSEAIGNLKLANVSLEFIHLTFAVHFEDIDTATHFGNLITCPTLCYKSKVMFCANLRQIRDLLVIDDTQCKDVVNQLHGIISKLGFKSLFGAQVFNKNGSFKFLK